MTKQPEPALEGIGRQILANRPRTDQGAIRQAQLKFSAPARVAPRPNVEIRQSWREIFHELIQALRSLLPQTLVHDGIGVREFP